MVTHDKQLPCSPLAKEILQDSLSDLVQVLNTHRSKYQNAFN